MSTIMPRQDDHVNQMGDAADQVFDAIHELMHLYRARRHGDAAEAGGLPHMEQKTLGFFARNPGATQSDLVAHSGRDKGQVARLIAGLRERGLLEAEPHEADKRSVRLRLTPQAQALHRAMKAQAGRTAKAAVAGLTRTECDQLLQLLMRIRANLEPDAS